MLAALGLSRLEAAASIRFGLGRATTAAEIGQAIEAVAGAEAQHCACAVLSDGHIGAFR